MTSIVGIGKNPLAADLGDETDVRDRQARGPGLVSLVGAGPGDPELITLKGARRLAEADIVLHDALVTPEMLALAGRALRYSVGKRAGRPSTAQERIHAIMIRAARRGRRVVRLKCGDPFVFGRGGEEATALAEAGIPCEVVPGVTSALSAPALQGIPVTHRGLASGFLVVSGHASKAYRPVLESLAPHTTTVVILMGLATRADTASLLLARGWSPTTPVAVLLGASTEATRTWIGTLSDLGQTPLAAEGLPGTIVIGDVVSLAGAGSVPATSDAVAAAR
jgi:uroporphyrin-III C-methyltransferase/precorrin-2 dehydrogenase/sirohydrochlorin ferrochelatase